MPIGVPGVELVGREGERDALWRALTADGGRWVFVQGPTGVGKSALVEDVRLNRRVALVPVQCARDEVAIEGAATRRLLAALVAQAGERPTHAWDQLRLLHLEVSEGAPRLQLTGGVLDRWARILREAVSDRAGWAQDMLSSDMKLGPVLVIEDAQWMDATTRDVLARWLHVETVASERTCAIVTSRAALPDVWAGRVAVIEVQPLSVADAEDLLEREVVRQYGWHPQAVADCRSLIALDPTPFAVRWIARQWVAAAQRGQAFEAATDGESGRELLRRAWQQLPVGSQRFVIAVWLGRDIVLPRPIASEASGPLAQLLYHATEGKGMIAGEPSRFLDCDEARAAARGGWVQADGQLGWRLAHDRLAQVLEREGGDLTRQVEAAVADVVAPIAWARLREYPAGVLHVLWLMAERSVGGVLAERLRVALAARYFWGGMAEMCSDLVTLPGRTPTAQLRLRYAVAAALRQDHSDAAAAMLVARWVREADALLRPQDVSSLDAVLSAGLYAEWLAMAACGATHTGVVMEALAYLRSRAVPGDTRVAVLVGVFTQVVEYPRASPEVADFNDVLRMPATVPASWEVLGWPAAAHDDQAERMAFARMRFLSHVHDNAWDDAAPALLGVMEAARPMAVSRAAFVETLTQICNLMSLGRIHGFEMGHEFADALAARARIQGNTTSIDTTVYHQLLARMSWTMRPEEALEVGEMLWRIMPDDGDQQSRPVAAMVVYWRAALLAGRSDLRMRSHRYMEALVPKLVTGHLLYVSCLVADEALQSRGQRVTERSEELVERLEKLLTSGVAHMDSEVAHFILCRGSLSRERRAEGDRLVRQYLADRNEPAPIRPFLLAVGGLAYGDMWAHWMQEQRPVMAALFERHQAVLTRVNYRARAHDALERLGCHTALDFTKGPSSFEEVWRRAQVEAQALVERARRSSEDLLWLCHPTR